MRMPLFGIVAITVSLSASLLSAVVAIPQSPTASASITSDESKLAGTWRGDSLCVEKGTACHDEVAVYRIAAIPGKRGLLMVAGGKIADGKEIVMGSGEWRYDSGKRTITGELPRGVIVLKLEGDKLEGTFTTPPTHSSGSP